MTKEDFISGQTLLLNKPVDWTSFDVVNKLRFSLRKLTSKKNIKVGHAGTLDPFATGLLIICTGKSTKTIDSITGQKKEYIAEFELGVTTDSQDVTGEVKSKTDVPDNITEGIIQDKINTLFLGDIEQIPPMHSAIKIDGVRLYKHARKGKEVERKPRHVHIFSYDIISYSSPILKVKISCSKGTYIRTLAYDLGEKLGVGAYCKTLQRTKIGDHKLEDAFQINEMVQRIQDIEPNLFS